MRKSEKKCKKKRKIEKNGYVFGKKREKKRKKTAFSGQRTANRSLQAEVRYLVERICGFG